MLSLLSRSEGLGHFPTSHFQPTRRSAGGQNPEVVPLPMLATNVFPLSLTTTRKPGFAKLHAKEKRCNLKKITTLPKTYFCRTFLFALFSTSAISFAVAVTIRMPCIAHAVKQRVELPPLRDLFRWLIWEKELVYGYIVTV